VLGDEMRDGSGAGAILAGVDSLARGIQDHPRWPGRGTRRRIAELEEQMAVLRAAAASLQTAISEHATHEDVATARAMLDLARSLARVTKPKEVAERLAEAVPGIAGVERASVWFWDPKAGLLRGQAVNGYGKEVAEIFVGLEIKPEHTPELERLVAEPQPRFYSAETEDPFVRAMFAAGGSAGAFLVPIVEEGTFVGLISVDSTAEQPIRVDEAARERLNAVAEQAAAALKNVRLVRDLKRSEERVRHQAYHDPLTGLPNRLLFEDRLEAAVASARRHQHRLALMFVDLDRFKSVNDSHGHQAGNSLLQQVAKRLRDCVREEDTVARVGGDEFTVLLPRLTRVADSVTVARTIRDSFQEPFKVGAVAVQVSLSIGVGVFPDDGDTSDLLLKISDQAMYRVKEKGRDGFRFHVEPAEV